MPKPVCVPCRKFYRPFRNGTVVEEGMPRGGEWVPYKLWMADTWRCESCGHLMVTGFASEPFAHHFQPNYQQMKDETLRGRVPDRFVRVDDC